MAVATVRQPFYHRTSPFWQWVRWALLIFSIILALLGLVAGYWLGALFTAAAAYVAFRLLAGRNGCVEAIAAAILFALGIWASWYPANVGYDKVVGIANTIIHPAAAESQEPKASSPKQYTEAEAKAYCEGQSLALDTSMDYEWPLAINDFRCVAPTTSKPAPTPTSNGGSKPSTTSCSITAAELAQMKADATAKAKDNLEAIGLLVASLDARWESISAGNKDTCGFWHNEGENVPDNTVLWTNFHHSSSQAKVKPYFVDGDYGVFLSTGAFDVPKPNSGGRYFTITGDVTVDTPTGCLTAAQLDAITSATNPQVAFDKFFEDEGYKFGKNNLAKGAAVEAGIFEGTFDTNAAPTTADDLAKGFIWRIKSTTTVPNGGRWMAECSTK